MPWELQPVCVGFITGAHFPLTSALPRLGSPAHSILCLSSFLSTAVQWNWAHRVCYFSASWEPPNWQTAHAGIHSGDGVVLLEAKSPPHCGRLWRSAPLRFGRAGLSNRCVFPPELSASCRRGPGQVSSLFMHFLSFLPLSTSGLREELLFTPQIPITESNQMDTQECLPSPKLCPVFPPLTCSFFPSSEVLTTSLFSHTGGCRSDRIKPRVRPYLWLSARPRLVRGWEWVGGWYADAGRVLAPIHT